jgi:FkbM family methyltransferase
MRAITLPHSSLWHIGETMRDVDPMLKWIAQRFKVGSFLDVGAHVGEIGMLAAFHFGAGLNVTAYEPHPELAEMCKQNLQAAGLENTKTIRAALSADRTKTDIDLHQRGTSLLGCSTTMTDRIVRTISVPATHPDTMPPADVLNIDVEGVEAEIVEGYMYWGMPHAAIVETHSREQSARIRKVMDRETFELVKTVDHPNFPYRLELWSR